MTEGSNVLALLPFPSANWSSTAPDNPPRLRYGRPVERFAYAPRDEQEFRRFIEKTVRHYKGRTNHWQIFNEPLASAYALPRRLGYGPSDYAHWLKVASRTAKSIDPQCKVLAGFTGLGTNAANDLDELLQEGTGREFDILTLHYYPRITPPERVVPLLQEINAIMDRYGGHKPIWITEHGYYADDDPEVTPHGFTKHATPLPSERIQAEYAIRFNTLLLANGVEKIFYHSGRTTRLNRDNIEGIFFEFGGVPRKIYTAIAAFTHILGPGVSFVKRLDLAAGIHAYLFQCPCKKILVTWVPEAEENRVLRLSDDRFQAYDIMANPLMGNTIPLTSAPVYIQGTVKRADEFMQGVTLVESLKRDG